MNGHVTHLLMAYLDRALPESRQRAVEAHLEQCSSCRQELESQRRLSSLLHEWPAPAPASSPERFAAQVRLRLPRQAAQPAARAVPAPRWDPRLELAWKSIPIALIGMWALGQAVALVTHLLLPFALVFRGVSSPAFSLPAQGYAYLRQVEGILSFVLGDASLAGLVEALFSGFSLSLMVSFLTAVLFGAWIASWIAFCRPQVVE